MWSDAMQILHWQGKQIVTGTNYNIYFDMLKCVSNRNPINAADFLRIDFSFIFKTFL